MDTFQVKPASVKGVYELGRMNANSVEAETKISLLLKWLIVPTTAFIYQAYGSTSWKDESYKDVQNYHIDVSNDKPARFVIFIPNPQLGTQFRNRDKTDFQSESGVIYLVCKNVAHKTPDNITGIRTVVRYHINSKYSNIDALVKYLPRRKRNANTSKFPIA